MFGVPWCIWTLGSDFEDFQALLIGVPMSEQEELWRSKKPRSAHSKFIEVHLSNIFKLLQLFCVSIFLCSSLVVHLWCTQICTSKSSCTLVKEAGSAREGEAGSPTFLAWELHNKLWEEAFCTWLHAEQRESTIAYPKRVKAMYRLQISPLIKQHLYACRAQ